MFIPQVPISKKQIMRNNTGIKKIASTSYTSSSSMNKILFPNIINYPIKEENEKKEKREKIYKERNNKINYLKNLKRHFFSGNLILPKPSWFRTGKNINATNKNKNKMIKKTFSDMQSFCSFFNYNYTSNNNSNTTANTHNNSNKKNNSNSFQKFNKYKINLKTFSRKNSMKQNYIKKNNNYPIKHSININQNKIIKEEEIKNNNNNNINIRNKNIIIKDENNNNNLYINNSIYNNYNEEEHIKKYKNIKYSGEYINDILDNLLKEEKELKIKISQN